MSNSADNKPLMPALRLQARVITAILMREVITRYGRHNVGFLWLFLEPLSFCGGITILWNIINQNGTVSGGYQVTPFIVIGYSCLLLWRNCAGHGIKAIEPNRSLLHHRQVKIMDIFIARMMLELLGVTAACSVVYLIMWSIGQMNLPQDSLLMLAGWLYECFFSACLGIVLGCLSEHSELTDRIWHPAGYFLLAGSGTFFMVDWLPQSMQKVVLLIPMVHPVEMMRAGYYGDSPHFHYSIVYMTLVCLVMALLALLLMADRRMKLLTS